MRIFSLLSKFKLFYYGLFIPFFICFDDALFLDKQYTVWGRVTSGMEYVDMIKKGEPPVNPDIIVKMQVASDVKE